MNNLRVAAASLVLLSIVGVQADAARRAERERDVQREERVAASTLLVGRLEMIWGDSEAATADARFEVTLVDDAGKRHPLDPGQALRAAHELHALFGKRVAISTVPVAAKRGGAGGRVIDAIVPIGDLVPSRAAETQAKVSGVTRWITVGCRFSDVAATPRDRDYFQSIYGNQPTQLGHYWDEVSYGKISLTGSIAQDWKNLPQPRAFYVPVDPATNTEDANLDKLFDDCIALHDQDVDFSVNGGAQGVNMVFNDNLDGAAWGGGRCVTLDGINKCWSTTWLPPWSYTASSSNGTATMGHEMGHGYGLPHTNNSDNDSTTYDSPWDVMSDSRRSNSALDAVYGRLPKHLSMYSRNRLGWVDAARKIDVPAGSGTQTIALDRSSLRGSTRIQMVTLSYPGQTNRYYTIEARKVGGLYEAAMPGDAVIVHEILTTRSQPAWSLDADVPPATYSNNEGSMFKPGEYWMSTDGAFCVRVDSASTDGFNITVNGKCPRLSGPGQRHLAGSGAVAAPATARAAATPRTGPAARPRGGGGSRPVAKPAAHR